MIAIMPHADGGESDEDNLDREQRGEAGGNSRAHTLIRNLVAALNQNGPAAARLIKLYATSLIHMSDAHVHQDEPDFDQACDEAVDHLHDLFGLLSGGNKRGSR
jgi:hypothetical protein